MMTVVKYVPRVTLDKKVSVKWIMFLSCLTKASFDLVHISYVSPAVFYSLSCIIFILSLSRPLQYQPGGGGGHSETQWPHCILERCVWLQDDVYEEGCDTGGGSGGVEAWDSHFRACSDKGKGRERIRVFLEKSEGNYQWND